MSFSVGIVGLPNVGKSTLFKALTRQKVDISNYPFCTINPNFGIVQVPDKRLEKIAEIVKPEKITPTVIEFVDIAGLVKNAHLGEGLGNQFLAHIREADAVLEVVRNFENESVVHVEGEPDPQRDIEIVNTELMMKDLETIEKVSENLKKETKSGNKEAVKRLEILEKFEKLLNDGNMLNDLAEDEFKVAGEIQLLTAKPVIYVLNAGEGDSERLESKPEKFSLALDLKTEEEISELSDEEKKDLELKSKIPDLIKLCYQVLGLITFYTIKGGKETRAWTLKQGQTVLEAAGIVHGDFKEKFIKAEVISFEKFITAGSWQTAREKGRIRAEGKEYIVQDGDIIEFKI